MLQTLFLKRRSYGMRKSTKVQIYPINHYDQGEDGDRIMGLD